MGHRRRYPRLNNSFNALKLGETSLFFSPDWPIPKNVRALCTTRVGGVSSAPFNTFNLAIHVEDSLPDVLTNRKRLALQANLPNAPIWLNQQHTDVALQLTNDSHFQSPPVADASWTQANNVVSVVMTADCLPILVTDNEGTCVAAIHAGWKGLADKIVTKTIHSMPVEPKNLMAWIGPAISVKYFEVGQEVFDAFVGKQSECEQFFHSTNMKHGKYLADLPGLVRYELKNLGINQVYQSNLCSFEDSEQFFSYRREGKTGRMASMIWLEG